jgi:inosine-uridine nucleoside N-ribohydrolase
VLSLLRDDRVELRAVTVEGTGEAHCAPGIVNARRLLAAMGASDVPVACGREDPGPNGRWFPPEWRAGVDALYGVELPPVEGESTRGEPAPALLARLAAADPGAITLVTLGPWTNVQDAAALDASFAANLAGIHAMAGAIDVPGNIDYGDTTAADGVEWNVGADPDAVAAVLATKIPITLVPLDATNDVPVPSDFAETLAGDHAAAGADIAYELYARNPWLASGSSFWDTLAAILLDDPSIARWEDLAVRMEPTGSHAGHLARDPGGRPVRAALSADAGGFMQALLAALRTGAPRAAPFDLAGALEVRWDGTACTIVGDAPSQPGTTRVTLVNTTPRAVGLAAGHIEPPKTWRDAMALLPTLDLADPSVALPDWIVQIPLQLQAPAGARSAGFAPLPAGEVGVVCVTGTYPKVTFHDGGSFTLSGR